MSQHAVIDTELALKCIKSINESVININDGCKKLSLQLAEASKETNLKSVEAIKEVFDKVSENMNSLQVNMNDLVYASEKYAQEVTEIDAEDTSIYDK